MGKINGCLKCLFIFFNVVFVVLGCVLIYTAVRATSLNIQMSQFGAPGLGWLWVIAIGVLGISCLGIYASCAEKDIALKIFAGFMGIGMIIMLIFGIIMVVIGNKTKDAIRGATSEFAKRFMEDESGRNALSEMQGVYHCCGVSGAEDWGSEIPQSCECMSVYQCRVKPQGASGPASVYKEGCSVIILSWVELFFSIAMGILFGFAVTALMGLLISFLMIHQVKRHDGAGGPSIAMKGY
ncbi:tetraspanin-8-like [Cololabis saira]|uniref:tetraspanin-8-like n=1 Tax=Cololabis saira TaxID=129043 RepID=UPI002AD3D6EA|nr:tetraspanin-8-like [Cololabis saira]